MECGVNGLPVIQRLPRVVQAGYFEPAVEQINTRMPMPRSITHSVKLY